jgi:hypothetical protein
MSIVEDIRRVRTFCQSVLPERTGPHAVGTARLKLRMAGNLGDARTITIQLWYPAEKAAGPPVLGWLARLRHPTWAPAHHGAPLRLGTSKLPFITYVPDSDRNRVDNTFTLANLASHGFVLAAIVDPFHITASHAMEQATTDEAGGARPDAVLCEHRLLYGVRTASALLDALQTLESDGRGGGWSERLDLRQVGILGYGLGGAVAAATTLADSRYVVAANLDGLMCGDARIVTTPYLLMLSDFSMPGAGPPYEKASDAPPSASRPTEQRRAQRQAGQPESHVIEVAGTEREHFSDRLVFPSLLAGGQRLPNYKRIRAIIDSYTVAFFGTYLQRAEAHPLMCVRHSPYAEVRFVFHSAEQMALLHREPAGRG